MQYVDTHLHLTKARHPDALCLALHENNIKGVSVSVDFKDSLNNLKLASSDFVCAVGLHPLYIKTALTNLEKDEWLNLFNHNKVLAIGECGLDGSCDFCPLSAQISNLRFFCDLAVRFNLPLSLHIRKNHGDLLKVLKDYQGQIHGVIHGFTFSKELAKDYLNSGFKLGIGRYGLKAGSAFKTAIVYAGIANLVLESDFDGSFDYDFNLLGQVNFALSELLKLEKDQCEALLYKNSLSLFNLY